ncbi:MAG: glycosyltransferase family 2 protein [Paramuribaculum sp.]|nr:glycosyltransferase family 2 protein [Paramuribaculum sp.]
MNPVVSVIILTYNQQATIARTIESVLAQREAPDFEIVIGEDCSTDSTREICERYAERFPGKIRLLPQEPNKGLTRNYRDCFLESRGKYITDCPGDDIWTDPLFLKKATDILESLVDVSIVYSGIDGHPSMETERKNGREMLDSLLDATTIPPIVLSASLYRSAIVMHETEKKDIFGYYVEDYPIMASLLNAGDAYALKGESLQYDRSIGSLSRPSDIRTAVANAIHALEMRLALAESYSIPQDKLNNFIKETTGYIAANLLRHPDRCLMESYDQIIDRHNLRLTKKARLCRAIIHLINRRP